MCALCAFVYTLLYCLTVLLRAACAVCVWLLSGLTVRLCENNVEALNGGSGAVIVSDREESSHSDLLFCCTGTCTLRLRDSRPGVEVMSDCRAQSDSTINCNNCSYSTTCSTMGVDTVFKN